MSASRRASCSLTVGAAAAVALLAGCSGSDALDAWPATLAVQSATSQVGLIGSPVNESPAVKLLDVDGDPIAGASITFTVTAGGGSLIDGPYTIGTTGSDGIARAGPWSITAGANRVRASLPAPFRVDPVTFAATGVPAAYQISLSYLTTVSAPRQAVFAAAAARWAQLIYGDVPDINLVSNPIPPNLCFDGQPGMAGVIDDLLIHVILDSIDGPGAILGGAGPCFIRSTGDLPLHGVMIFDTADVATLESGGSLDEVILHEMGHVLGFGSLWSPSLFNLLVGPAAQGGTDPHFIGATAVAAFDRIGGTAYTGGAKVPVENCIGFAPGVCGAGSQDSHWRESVFGNELMTGFLSGGVANPLSVVTVASMGDETYLVNHAGADSYVRAFAAPPHAPGGPAAPRIALGDDVLRLPIHTVDPHGRLTSVRRP